MNAKRDRAPIIAPPPLLGLVCIGLGFLAEHFKPWPLFPAKSVVQLFLGAVLILVSVGVIASARRIFIAHGTHLNPYRPTKAVVVTGVYRFSRNPIYIAFILIVLAFALFVNSLWFVFPAGLLFILLHFGVVKREETYLAEKFGDTYKEYCRRVHRWI